MKQRKKQWLLLLPVLLLGVLAAVFTACRTTSNEIVLEFGMFTGSYWDVANADSFAIIDKAIANDTYEKAQDALAESKNLVLDKYNMFEYIASLCDTLNPKAEKKMVTLKPCRSGADIHNFWNYTVMRGLFKLKMKAINLLCGNTLMKKK